MSAIEAKSLHTFFFAGTGEDKREKSNFGNKT